MAALQASGTAFESEFETLTWDSVTALAALDIKDEPFEMLSGNLLDDAKAGAALAPVHEVLGGNACGTGVTLLCLPPDGAHGSRTHQRSCRGQLEPCAIINR